MTQSFTSFQDFKRRYPIRPNDEGALLGSGSYGRVIKVEDQLETEWVAIKISEFKGNDTKSLKAEVELAQRVPRQANIARYDACYRLETDTSVSDFAIMKYYSDGNLADLLRRVTLTPTQIYDLTQGILLGLQHLHRHRIVHRDFKPANILISRDNAGRFIPKIADFGLSKLVSDDELDSSDFDLSDGRGTPSYKAPEQIEGSRVSFNLDLWAFGVILYELMTGEKPFRSDLKNSSEQSVRREIEKKIISVELPDRLNQIAEPYAAMIRRCLVRDIHERVRKESELLDLLDCIPQRLADAQKLANRQQYREAINLFEQILAKREHHADAQQGLTQCRAAIDQQQINDLLTKAADLLAQQQTEQAKHTYEQVLQLEPAHAEAARGLVLCIERLQPKPLAVAEAELTDVYQEEKTDVYVPPPVSVPLKTVRQPAVVSKPGIHGDSTTSRPLLTKAVPDAVIGQPIASIPARAFPWRVIVPVAIGVAGLGLYFTLRGPEGPTGKNTQKIDSTSTTGGVPSNGLKSKTPSNTETTVLLPLPGESKAALNKRIDVALDKARQAYKRKDYGTALVLTNSALHLDPARRDVLALRDAAGKEMQKQTPLSNTPLSATVTATESPKVATPESANTNPAESVEDANEKLAKAKQEQQNAYDELIEEGIKAIANGNNKTKAIAAFTKAHASAKEHELVTTKADGAYTVYMTKADKIFATDEFDGAKSWYLVAQALKDTPDVRRKIKQCTNQ
jgi:serine/threonine protein kinase